MPVLFYPARTSIPHTLSFCLSLSFARMVGFHVLNYNIIYLENKVEGINNVAYYLFTIFSLYILKPGLLKLHSQNLLQVLG